MNYRIICNLLAFLSTIPIYSASFTLFFTGNNAAKVHINGKEYTMGGSHKEKSIDTRVEDLRVIAWTQSKKVEKSGGDFDVVEYDYAITLPKAVNPLNVGGWFKIGDDGFYSYNFGVDGENIEGTTAYRVNESRKVF